MATNPFEALLTPENLRRRREAELTALNAKQPNFWVQQANRAGANLRQTLRERGIGLSQRDRQAAYNQGILENAAQTVAGMVKDGMDPNEARALALETAGSEFLKNGNYEEAQEVMGQANQIRTMLIERQKLKAEADYWQNVKPVVETQRAGAAVGQAEAAQQRAETAAGRAPAQNVKDVAQAGYYDRMPQEKGTSAPGSALNKSARFDIVSKMAGWMGYTQKAEQIATVLQRAARTGTVAAGGLAGILNEVKGILGTAPGNVAQIMGQQDTEGRASYSRMAPEIARTADRLGVNRALYNSLVIDIAYDRARARDSGGRLSDNDIKLSMQALGASGDAESMLATLRNDLGNLWQSTSRDFRYNKLDTDEEPAWVEGLERARQMGFEKTPKQAAPVPTGVPAPAAKGETLQERAKRLGIPGY